MSTPLPITTISPLPPPQTPPPPHLRRKLSPSAATTLLDNCNSPRQLLEIHAAILRSGIPLHNTSILNFKLQRSYSTLGHLDQSLILFHRTPPNQRNVFFWTSIIQSHAYHGLRHSALDLYSQMLSDGVVPNAFTFSSVLRVCDVSYGRILHCQCVKLELKSDSYVGTTIVDMYARGGEVDDARKMFERMPERNLVCLTTMITCYTKAGEVEMARGLFDEVVEKDLVCWNTMIDGYTQHSMPNVALSLFRRMLRELVRPNEVTALSVLSACAQIGALELGKWVHSYVQSCGIKVDTQVATALIDMYCKCGSLDDACLVFDNVSRKDVVCWNAMIVGNAMHGRSNEALKLFDQMRAEGIRPTDITFIGVLNACSHAGLVPEGRELFQLMEVQHQISPKIEHYGCMVDLLGRAGLVQEAYELVQTMPIKPDTVMWGALLGACRLHKKVKLGKKIAEHLVSTGLANSATYVLLSNIYATMGNWAAAARVRTMMKDTGIQKEPGCTSIELENKVHEFVVGDLSHPKTDQIYSMLDELNVLLKSHGYKPQTDVVLHDMDEPEKERALGVHSEKLAIALGLVSTKPGTTIKIVKNLRVCVDCHNVTKLISKITGRKIVVRDRNRFHQFVDGSCSCGDYW